MAPALKRARTSPASLGTAKRRTISKRPLTRTVTLRQRRVRNVGTQTAFSSPSREVMRSVALALKETKLFKVDWQTAGYSVSQVAGKAYAVRGFVTTSAADPSGGPTLSYGATVITDLHMARPFHSDNATGNLAQMALEGRRVIPTSAHNDISVDRSSIDTSTVATANSAAPVYCRLITVTPKGPAGTTMVTAPDTDLFITAWGEEMGPGTTGTNAMGANDFAQAVVNPNKYHVLRDSTKILYQAVTHGTTLVAGGSTEDQVNTISQNPTMIRWRVNHQIADKKGGQVLYNNPNSAVAPEAGHRREYTFLHFWQPGQLNDTQFAQVPTRLTIRCRPYSAFKEG